MCLSFYNLDFFFRETIEVVDLLVDFVVGGGYLVGELVASVGILAEVVLPFVLLW